MIRVLLVGTALAIGLIPGAYAIAAAAAGHPLPPATEMVVWQMVAASLFGAAFLAGIFAVDVRNRGITCRPGERIRYNVGG